MSEIFQDHAVLEREKPIIVWGQAPAGDPVRVSLASDSVSTQADASGHWRAVLPALPAGGPFVLTAQDSAGQQRSASDVLVGDVFLCSGQSNMQMPVQAAENAWNEIQESSASTLRLLSIGHAISPTPLSTLPLPVSWQIASPASVSTWSAACFFFARELQKTVHVPLGLIQSTWDGSNIRPWISASALKVNGSYKAGLELLTRYAADQQAAQGLFARQWEEWWRTQTGERPGTEPWSVPAKASPGLWRPAPAALGDWREWGVPELQHFTGLVWYRTHIKLTAKQAQAASKLTLGAINQVDETWLNGRAVGNTFGYNTERVYALPSGMLHAGDNVLAINVLSTYGAGGLLAGPATRALELSDGGKVPLQSPWEYRMVPASVGYPPRTPWESVGGLTTIYNAMIAPLGQYGVRAVLWYQGESNTGEASTYQGLLQGLMADWRHQLGAELAFLIVQLPNYGAPRWEPGESGWAELREAQRRAVAQDPHAGLVVTIDIGEPGNLHPANKQDVGSRLARVARHVIYGESVTPSGPVAVSATRSDGQIAVALGDIEGGLVAYSHEAPIGFELCAAGVCRFAEARIAGTQVLLSIPAGLAPTRVRYCWGDSPVCTLHDRSGLPAGPFELTIR
jgi:sialate O-acetylesterase